MNKKTRTIIFISFFCCFLVISPFLIFRSMGYRFDFREKRFLKTGGIHITVRPSPAEIYINNQFKRETGAFLGSALISNLLPKEYEIKIKREGYNSWTKNLEVKEGKITRAFNLILFKENPEFKVLEKEVEEFFSSHNNISFLKNDTLTFLLSEEKDGLSLKENNLYFKEEIIREDVLDYKKKDENIFIINKEGLVKKINFKGEIIKILNQKPLSENYKIEKISNENVFLSKNEELFLLKNELKKVHHQVKGFSISSDNKLVIYNNHEIWIHDLKEKTFLTRFSKEIRSCFWLNPYYLILNIGNEIKVLETDTRDRINMYKIAEFNDPQINWIENKLYVFDENTIFFSEEIIP